MVDVIIDLIYVQLTIITSKKETLAKKAAFEIWYAILGVKINRYHAYNGRFSEKYFRSEI